MSARISWPALVEMEPALGRLADRAARSPGPYRDELTFFYEEIKPALLDLVGWGRRASRWSIEIPEGTAATFGFLRELSELSEPARIAQVLEDQHAGRAVLWTSMAYDVAYRRLLHLCEHTREAAA